MGVSLLIKPNDNNVIYGRPPMSDEKSGINMKIAMKLVNLQPERK